MSFPSELTDYIKEKRNGGLSDEAIRTILMGAGWDKNAIDSALASLGNPTGANETGSSVIVQSQAPSFSFQPNQPVVSTELSKSRRPMKMLAIFIVIMAIGVSAFVFAQIYFGDPLATIQKSFTRFASSTSWTANFFFSSTSFSDNISATVNFHKDTSQFSQAKITAADINGTADKNGSLTADYNSKDLYLNFYYSRINDILNQFVAKYPPLLGLQTFNLLQPFLLNQEWLHFVIPTSTVNQATPTINDAARTQLAADFSRTFVLKSYNQNFSQNGTAYQQIIVAIDKTKLIDFLQSLKNYDINVSIAQLNSFISTVNSMNGWDGNIFEILIDKNTGDLNEVKMNLPKLPQSILQQVIPSSIPTSTENPFAQFLTGPMQSISNFFNQNSASGSLMYIGKVDFSNYNQAPTIEVPTQIGEFTSVQSAIASELPLIIATFNSTGIGSSTTSIAFTRDLQQVHIFWSAAKLSELLATSQDMLKQAKSDQDKSTAHYWIGIAYFDLKNYPQSEQEELLAVKLNPKFNGPYVTLSAIALARNDCAKALSYAQTAVSLDDTYPYAHNDMGLAYACLGDTQKAIAEIQKAVQLAPDNGAFQLNLRIVQQGGK